MATTWTQQGHGGLTSKQNGEWDTIWTNVGHTQTWKSNTPRLIHSCPFWNIRVLTYNLQVTGPKLHILMPNRKPISSYWRSKMHGVYSMTEGFELNRSHFCG